MTEKSKFGSIVTPLKAGEPKQIKNILKYNNINIIIRKLPIELNKITLIIDVHLRYGKASYPVTLYEEYSFSLPKFNLEYKDINKIYLISPIDLPTVIIETTII